MPHAITAMNGAHFLFAFGALAPMTWPSLKRLATLKQTLDLQE